jgi:hypothetical protein
LAYLPTVDNSFISDDFTLLRFVSALDENPWLLWDAPSELFRVVSYVYFWASFKIFGLSSEPYYWSSIALHATVSLLVFVLVLTITQRRLAAWTAATFFAVYARHEEAVMWISANNETIFALSCLVFLLLWELYLRRPNTSYYVLALAVFPIALFSKEAAVVLLPLAMLRMSIVRGSPAVEVMRRSWPLAAMLGAFSILWLSQANRNFFVTQGHYEFGLHFFPVYLRSLFSLLSSAFPFAAALWIAGIAASHPRKSFQAELSPSSVSLKRDPNLFFFLVWVVLAVAPYSFLTYAKYIPSRNTYWPSIGLAALIGVMFAVLYGRSRSKRASVVCMLLLAAVLTRNMTYLWQKQDARYVKRAAPTRELIGLLNGPALAGQNSLIHVCGFPLHPSIGKEAVAQFTNFKPENVEFQDTCDPRNASMKWQEERDRYELLVDQQARESTGPVSKIP